MAYNVFSGTLNPAQATPLLVFTCHMGSHSVIIGSSVLSPGRGDIPAFTPAEAGTRFSNPRGMQG